MVLPFFPLKEQKNSRTPGRYSPEERGRTHDWRKGATGFRCGELFRQSQKDSHTSLRREKRRKKREPARRKGNHPAEGKYHLNFSFHE